MKTLLAVGCSYTDEKFESIVHPELDCSWPKWPEIIGNELEYNTVNLGECGNSNDSIFKTAQDYIVDHKVDMICALWTQGHRLNIHDMSNINWTWSFMDKEPVRVFGDRLQKDVFNKDEFSSLLRWKHTALANEYLRYIYMLDQLGKYNNNIPVYHMQGLRGYYPYGSSTRAKANTMRKEYATAFLDSPYFSILDKQTNIYGWPLLQELEGSIYIDDTKALASYTWKEMEALTLKYKISDKDSHPNARGHKIIANRFIEMIK
jgi:hypothetical protein